MNCITLLQESKKRGAINARQFSILQEFYHTFSEALVQNNKNIADHESVMHRYFEEVIHEIQNPFQFEPYHEAIRAPFDYYRLGLEVFGPLVIVDKSKIFHPERLKEIVQQLSKGENVILLANHQTEPDPQFISFMLEKDYPQLAEKMIFVAGHRVITDPTAIPLSKGRNLLCIFSKKHIEHPPEQKQEKQLHNQRTMHRMSELLAEGGKCIYVAPSGGRDRMNETTGQVEVAPYDPQSIEMFWLMAQHSGKPTHFYPLTLSTYYLLPPPKKVEKEIGERRNAKCAPVYLSFGPEVNMDHFPGSENLDKKSRRIARANYLWEYVKQEYRNFFTNN